MNTQIHTPYENHTHIISLNTMVIVKGSFQLPGHISTLLLSCLLTLELLLGEVEGVVAWDGLSWEFFRGGVGELFALGFLAFVFAA